MKTLDLNNIKRLRYILRSSDKTHSIKLITVFNRLRNAFVIVTTMLGVGCNMSIMGEITVEIRKEKVKTIRLNKDILRSQKIFKNNAE